MLGSATFICQYGFNKNAFCNASYQLEDGQIVGEGAFNFNASAFALVIVGGTGKYRGLTGDMEAAPAVQHSQRLDFVLALRHAVRLPFGTDAAGGRSRTE